MDPVTHSRHIVGSGTPASSWRADPRLASVPAVELDGWFKPGARLVVVAPHPDDEILACGGLLHLLAARGALPLIVAVTDGEGSHPDSSQWPPARLQRERAQETVAALAALGLGHAAIARLGLPDGGVTANQAALAEHLRQLLTELDVVVTTWRYDGHPDHEATARACASACKASGARLLEAPVWGWHWSAPHDGAMPLQRAFKIALAPDVVEHKRAALACFHSQLTPDASTGAAPVLTQAAIERILNPFELVFHDA